MLGFSHELRNLVNSVTGNVDLCLTENVSTFVKECLEKSKTGGKALIHLINNILDSGKAEVGDLEISMDEVRSQDLIHKIWDISA